MTDATDPNAPGEAPGPQPASEAPPAGPGVAAEPFPPELQAAAASKDERTWGMIAHLAALAGLVFLPFGAIVGPLVVWLIKKEESRFVAFHAKQCMWLQIFALGATIVCALLFFLFVTIPLAFLAYLGGMAYAVYGAIQVSSGKDFEYYKVGPWVRKSMT